VADALSLLDPAKVIAIVFNGDRRPLSNYYGVSTYYRQEDDRDVRWWQRLLNRGRRQRKRSR